MKKNIVVFGLIAGAILAIVMVVSTTLCYQNDNFEGNMVLGYASMLLAFSLIFVAIKNFRDKLNGGAVTFGAAFKIGLMISLIASTCYVIVWLIDYYIFIPDFGEKYAAFTLSQARKSGASQDEINKLISGMESFKEMYKNPLMVVLLTFAEVLPVGLAMTLFSALILKKQPKPE
jgi:hypothetical protein